MIFQCVSNVFPIQSRDCPFKVEIFHVSSTISPIPSGDVPRFPKVSPAKSSKKIFQQPAASCFFVPSVWTQNQSASNDPSPAVIEDDGIFMAKKSWWMPWISCHVSCVKKTCQKSWWIPWKNDEKNTKNTMKCDETYHEQHWNHLKSTAHELMMVMLNRGAPSALGDRHISGKDGENNKYVLSRGNSQI